jgi:hypothetical protein
MFRKLLLNLIRKLHISNIYILRLLFYVQNIFEGTPLPRVRYKDKVVPVFN